MQTIDERTFSMLDRIVACPTSEALPATPRPAEDDDDDAPRGNSRHEYLRALTDQESKPLANVPSVHHEMCEAMEIYDLEEIHWPYECEEAVAINLDTLEVRRLGHNIHRVYPDLGPGWIYGTVDAWRFQLLQGTRVRSTHAVAIVDHKGCRDPSLAPAATSLQLRFALLCALIITGGTEGEVSHRHWRDDGTSWLDGPHVVTLFELLEDVRRVSAALTLTGQASALLARGLVPDVNPGRWCRYCPAILACSETRKTWTALTAPPGPGGVVPAQADLMAMIRRDPAGARAAYEEAKRRIGEVGSQIAIYAQEVGGFDLGGGKRYGPHPVEDKKWDAGIAFAALTETHGSEAACAGVEMKATAASIERGLKAAKAKISDPVKAKAFKVATHLRAMLSEIEARGGRTTTNKTKTGEYRSDGVIDAEKSDD